MRNRTSLPFYPDCFICGPDNPRGLHCRFFRDGEFVRSDFKTECWMAGYAGVVHGGVIGAVLDEAIVWAAYEKTGLFGVTAEILIRFLIPLPVGVLAKVEGRMIENKGKIWVAEGRLLLVDGSVVAKATGKLIPLRMDQQEDFKGKIVQRNESGTNRA